MNMINAYHERNSIKKIEKALLEGLKHPGETAEAGNRKQEAVLDDIH